MDVKELLGVSFICAFSSIGLIVSVLTTMYIINFSIKKKSNITIFSDLVEYLFEAKFKIFTTAMILIIIHIGFKIYGHDEDMIYNLITIFITITFIDFIIQHDNMKKEKPVRLLAESEISSLFKEVLEDSVVYLGVSTDVLKLDGKFETEAGMKVVIEYLKIKSKYSETKESLCIKNGIVDFESKTYLVNTLFDSISGHRDRIKDIIYLYNRYLSVDQNQKLNNLRSLLEENALNINLRESYITLAEHQTKKFDVITNLFSESLVEVIKTCKGGF